jgi:NAD(P)-dependent dehydrogenase (short-subunit alcohol dehydrogenase family)
VEHTAVITGASQGLGLALAGALADRGWRLVIDARRSDRLDAAAAELATRTRVVALAGDITDAGHRAALAAAASRLGTVDLVVNNASTLGASPLPTVTSIAPETFAQILDVNVIAPVALIQALLPALGERPTVIDISSDAGVEAYETWGGYGASKAALDHVSRVLAAEQPTWRVLAVDPGDMRTEMHQDAFPGEDISDRPEATARIPALLALIDGDQPSGRYRLAALQPSEVTP